MNVCPDGLWSWLRLMSPLFLPLPAIISSVESERTSLRVTDRGERWAEEGGGGGHRGLGMVSSICVFPVYIRVTIKQTRLCMRIVRVGLINTRSCPPPWFVPATAAGQVI